MNINELADYLNVSPTTIRTWEKEFDISVKRDFKNIRKYDDNVKEVFEKIKELREQNSGFNTIRRTIGNVAEAEPEVTEILPESFIKKEIEQAFEKNIELAEKYAKATYRIGELEATVKFLNKENERIKEETKLLPAPVEYEKLKMQIEMLNKELEYHKKPWWKKIIF